MGYLNSKVWNVMIRKYLKNYLLQYSCTNIIKHIIEIRSCRNQNKRNNKSITQSFNNIIKITISKFVKIIHIFLVQNLR